MDASKVKAKDLMQGNVARIDAGTAVDEALSLLEADGISGAPVVDAGGRVVGVFSMTDVARAKNSEERGIGSIRREYYMPTEGVDEEADEFSYKEDYSPAVLATGTVVEWMSEEVVFVTPDDSMRVVCKRMEEYGIHRVLVLEDDQLRGILSSFDVVRWIAKNG